MNKLIMINIIISYSYLVDLKINYQNAHPEGCVNEKSEFDEGGD